MARPKAKAPARRYHISGQSVVTIAGRDIYLGKHDSPESIARYAVLISLYQANGLELPDDFDPQSLNAQAAALMGQAPPEPAQHQDDEPILVRHVTAAYREHVKIKHATEQGRFKRLCRLLDETHGDVPVPEFGPKRLKAFRQKLVDDGLSRTYVNRLTNCVVAMFRHAISEELVESPDVVARLETVTAEPLRKRQTTAHETKKTKPVSIEVVRETAKHLSPIIKAMLRIQVATGARPKEICTMRPCDVDRSGEVWVYQLAEHKTDWCGREKSIPLVGDARDALTDFLLRPPTEYCFKPAEAVAWRNAVRASERVTPMSCGNRPGTNRVKKPKRAPRERYDAGSYCQAIQRAANRAGVEKWHPYQIRHLTATEVRAALGIEEAKALLGHSTALMTEHYAKESIKAATKAAKVAPKL